MRIRASYVMAAAVSVAAAAWILSGQIGGRGPTGAVPPPAARAPAAPEPRAVRVMVVPAETRDEAIRLTGQTEANRKVELRAELDGRVVELPVERGALVRGGELVARLAVDDREARLQEAQAHLAQRRIELEAARTLAERGHRSAISVAEAQAKFDSAAAAVKRMEIEMARTAVAAPFAGVIEMRPVELGAFLKLGDPIVTLVDLDPLRVVGFVSEREVGRVALGAPAQARLAGGRRVDGRVILVGTVADAATRTFRVEVELPNPDRSLREGLTAELSLPVGSSRAHRVSPAALTLAENGAIGVKAVDAAGRVVFHTAQVAGEAPGGAIWLNGLPDPATLIVVGQEFVREGQVVRPVPVERAAAAPPR